MDRNEHATDEETESTLRDETESESEGMMDDKHMAAPQTWIPSIILALMSSSEPVPQEATLTSPTTQKNPQSMWLRTLLTLMLYPHSP